VFVFNLSFLPVDTSRTGLSFRDCRRTILYSLYLYVYIYFPHFVDLGRGRLQVDFRIHWT